MAFGQKRNTQDDNETHISNTPGYVDFDDEDTQQASEDETQPGDETETVVNVKEKDNNKPLLEEVTIIGAGKSKNAGGSKRWRCKHYKGTYTSTYTRIHVHFFGPGPGRKPEIIRCPVMTSNREMCNKLLKKVTEAESSGVSKRLKSSVLSKNTSKKNRIEETFGMLERNAVDMKIIRGLCANGIPFNVLRNPQFLEMVEGIQHAPAGYKPQSSEKARTNLLDECKHDVEKELTPFKDTFYTQGVSVVSDGWSNVKHNPLINVLAVNSRGAMFMYAEDYSGVEKTGVEIANFLRKAIEKIGPSNVLQVVTDNAANCKAAGREIEKHYGHIFWSPCCVHTLNLIFKDLASKLPWLFDTYKQGKAIVKYFLNHTHVLSFFRENSELELLKVAQTRFASHYILLRRLMDCREALATTIVTNSWREWFKKMDETTQSTRYVVTDTIKDDVFWDNVESILAFTKPIFLMIKFCDGEGPKMGEIYERMDNMVGEIKKAMKENRFSRFSNEIETIVLNRWEKLVTPLHCLGFALNPKFYDRYYLEGLAPGGVVRKVPNHDLEVVKGLMEAFSRISEDDIEHQKYRDQFATFHMKQGIYARPTVQSDAATMDPIAWWATYGSATPDLAEVAMKVLSQPISSSSAERNWSTYSYIHNVKRNRLNCDRADKLVFIHSNIRLQSRFSESYKSGTHKKWDINPESAYIEGSSARLEEMAWEDLDDGRVHNDQGKRKRVD